MVSYSLSLYNILSCLVVVWLEGGEDVRVHEEVVYGEARVAHGGHVVPVRGVY